MSKRVALLPLGVFCVFAALVACGDSDGKASDIAKMLSSSSEAIETFSSSDSELSSSSQKAEQKVKITYGFMKDPCDGRKYKTMTIGKRTWMAQNLNYKTPDSKCYKNDKRNCAKYGRLYTWDEANEVCPAGWHLATRVDWGNTIYALGGKSRAGWEFRTASGWPELMDAVDFWTSSEYYKESLGGRLYKAESYTLRNNIFFETAGLKSKYKSVRCVKDEPRQEKEKRRKAIETFDQKRKDVVTVSDSMTVTPASVPGPDSSNAIGSITDSRDGQTYKTVTVGKQTWMAQNLNYKIDGSSCYDNRARNCTKYGRLYEWTDAMDACPAGWHLPTRAEWDTLIDATGGVALAGQKLKSMHGWKDLNGKNFDNGTDEFGFTSLPAGFYSSGYKEKDRMAYFWSATSFTFSRHSGNMEVYDVELGGSYRHAYEKKRLSLKRCKSDFSHLSPESGLPEGYNSVWQKPIDSRSKLSVRCVKDDAEQKIDDSEKSSDTLVVSPFVSPLDVVKGTFKDIRDNRTYKTVTIGTQTWMAENLNYKTTKSSCFEGVHRNCFEYGRLYSWDGAMNACPAGWRLPMKADWDTLIASVGGEKLAGKMLRAMGDWGGMGVVGAFFNCVALGGVRAYYASDNGSDDYGFSVIPAGRSEEVTFWSSTEYSSYEAYILNLSGMNAHAKIDANYKTENFSVRCLKNNVKKVSPSSLVRDSITDARDGQTYKTVAIGVQTWMAQNLNYKTDSSYCYGDSVENCAKYGRLYTWKAAKDACPAGFHLPTQLEWDNLFLMAGGPSSAGDALRSKSGWMPTRWWQISDNGSDDYGFSALPAGYFESTYTDKGDKAYFGSSSVGSIEHYRDRNCGRHYRELPYSSWNHGRSVWLRGSAVHWTYSEEYKNQAYSIRCVKDVEKSVNPHRACPECVERVAESDSSSFSSRVTLSRVTSTTISSSNVLASVEEGSFTDSRDGQTYRTVKIGKQRWMAENLNYEKAFSSCYNDDARNCAKYGRLYTWESAKDACPAGWRVPKLTEWMTLIYTVGDTLSAGKFLKSANGWKDLNGNEYGNGSDDYGFSALPGGKMYNAKGRNEGHKAYFWGYTNDEKTFSIEFGGKYDSASCDLYRTLQEYSESKLRQWLRDNPYCYMKYRWNKDFCLPKEQNLAVWDSESKNVMLSVRCVKDEISRKLTVDGRK